MVITNRLKEDSFGYQKKLGTMEDRKDEILDLLELSKWCKNLKEQIAYDADILYYLEVEPKTSLSELLYNRKETDATRLLTEIICKNFKNANQQEENENQILCALGSNREAVGNLMEYVHKRQEYLDEINLVREYTDFMKSCFPNCLFAEGCESEFLHIEDFLMHKSEITKCLSVLNDEAIRLYEENHDNIKKAMDYLTAKLCTCAPDAKHKDKLVFQFKYEELNSDTVDVITRKVECMPHLKLINDGSNLRIYFYWKDNEIMDGKKVLIGRVGRHPWSKRQKN